MRLTHRLQQNGFKVDLFVQGVMEHPSHRSQVFQENLHRIRRSKLCKFPVAGDRLLALLDQLARIAQNAAELHCAHRLKKVVEKRLKVLPLFRKFRNHRNHLAGTVAQHRPQQQIQIGAVGQAEQRKNLFAGDRSSVIAGEKCDHLIEQRLSVAHPAFRGTGDRRDRTIVDRDLFTIGDQPQPRRNQSRRDRKQIEPLTA